MGADVGAAASAGGAGADQGGTPVCGRDPGYCPTWLYFNFNPTIEVLRNRPLIDVERIRRNLSVFGDQNETFALAPAIAAIQPVIIDVGYILEIKIAVNVAVIGKGSIKAVAGSHRTVSALDQDCL